MRLRPRWAGHHERRVPGERLFEDLRVPEQQAECAPPDLLKPSKNRPPRSWRRGIVALHERQDVAQQIGFLAHPRVGGIIRVPRDVRERRSDEDRVVFVRQAGLLNLGETVAVLVSVLRLDGQHVDHRKHAAWFQNARQQHANARRPRFIRCRDVVDDDRRRGRGCACAGGRRKNTAASDRTARAAPACMVHRLCAARVHSFRARRHGENPGTQTRNTRTRLK